MKKIMHIVILYSNEEEVLTHIRDLKNQSVINEVQIIIVVNKKNKEIYKNFLKEINKLDSSIKIYNPDKNLGYLNGCIYGFETYTKENPNQNFKWYTISNTDIEFRSNNFYKKLLKKSYEDDIWCIAPSVFNSKNLSYDNPHYKNRISKQKINRIMYIYKFPTLARIYEQLSKIKGTKLRGKKEKSQYVYSAHGCCFILKKEIMEILSNKKYKALMYSEESYIAELIRNKNKKIYYESEIEVKHDESTVTNKLGIIKKAKYISESLKLIKDEFYK